ncbi:MAG: ABC transporter permease, partial [Candidatus Binatia bacterium]
EYGSTSIRTQIIGYRLGKVGGPPAVSAGRPLAASRFEMVLDRKAGIPIGTRIPMGRIIFTVVGLTEGIVSSSGDSTAYVSLQDAQELQFVKANEAVRNERARLQADLHANPALAAVSAPALASITQNTNLANAILVRLEPWADAKEIAARIERWNHYRAMTTVEQEEVLAKNVIERARQQIMLFRIILLMVSTVVIALIIFTMTLEKTRDIATLKIIGAPNLKIGALIMQESLSLGLLGYLFGALLINLTYDYFPRRVAILAFDQYILFGIVIVICVLASLLGIRRALAIDPTTAMGGGA